MVFVVCLCLFVVALHLLEDALFASVFGLFVVISSHFKWRLWPRGPLGLCLVGSLSNSMCRL